MIELPADVIAVLTNVRSICVMTGAGVSAESGVPTFRGPDGLWKKFRPEELANVGAFLRNPGLVWEWYEYRRRLISECNPNAAHTGLARMETLVPEFLLVTQNVDGLHQRAGSRKIVELHGSIQKNRCMSCGRETEDLVSVAERTVPVCSACGGVLRPAVVWFGEQLPMEAYGEADRASRRCDFFILVGTSGAVYPAASLPYTARSCGAFVLEIDPEETDLSSRVDAVLRMRATEGVTAVVETLERVRNAGSTGGLSKQEVS